MSPEEIAQRKEETGKRAVFYYESAKRSVLAAEVLMHRLEAELAELKLTLHDTENLANRFGPVLITAMGIVDFAHRFGELVNGMPFLKTSVRRTHLQKLLAALVPVTEIRNHLQHLRQELAAGSSIDYPLMGSITWIDDGQCHAVGLLTQGFEVTLPTMPFGVFGSGYLARYQYTAASRSVLLDPLVATMRESFDWLASSFRFSDPSYDKVGWGKTVAISYELNIEISPKDSYGD